MISEVDLATESTIFSFDSDATLNQAEYDDKFCAWHVFCSEIQKYNAFLMIAHRF